MKTISTIFIAVVLVVLVVGAVASLFILKGQEQVSTLGSIIESQEYNATTTVLFNGGNGNTRADWQIKKGRGSLGSVVVTGAGDLSYEFYNATTTVAALRPAHQRPTSTILLGVIPANLAAGTYVFDVEFTTGLFMDVIGGNTATATITYR